MSIRTLGISIASAVALLIAAPIATSESMVATHDASAACTHDYDKNVNGRCVHRPGHDSAGATAKCRDGTYSYSKHASGTCSGHHGVARWIHHP